MKFKNSFTVSKTQMDLQQTLVCGQIFSYESILEGTKIYSGDKFALVVEREEDYLVQTDDKEYFFNFFDLDLDYDSIKASLQSYGMMNGAIEFGAGIRILKQDLLETIISFVISANNNIGRITKSVAYLRQNFGEDKGGYFAFPTLQKLSSLTEADFRGAGVGYRAPQLVKLIRQLANEEFLTWGTLETSVLKQKLIALSGIGPKVADCVMLFAYGKTDVFPVDTWIEKVFNQYFYKCTNREKIRRVLVDKFKDLSGYAQQYLFFYQRSRKV